eukprot:gnl/MRDRNA2_/MRDRNA2_115608_c0_seq1.p1 gnl/MRDRNA2_/MRDRNA2_115608_c0~~gnl/MRDRNA2_/MRDRNA2_115608_c0_seq1.p1  ORF type:complete len:615 (-),score=99.87 gnl/MRDRNA2_/MRDRNA2_115608_c0_seq1:20-1795(-)
MEQARLISQGATGLFRRACSTLESTPQTSAESNGENSPGAGLQRQQSLKSFMQTVERKSVVSAAELIRQRQHKEVVWTQSHKFQISVALIIVLNAVTLGLEPDLGDDIPVVFHVMEHFFTAIFVTECILRIRFEGRQEYFGDMSNWMDFFLVGLSILDVWIITPMGSDVDLRMLSLLRLLRLLRLARLVKLLLMFRELTILVRGFAASGKLLLWSGVFFFIVVYVFTIFGAMQFGKASSCDAASEADGKCDHVSNPLYDNINPEIGDQATLFEGVGRSMCTLSICAMENCGWSVIRPMVFKTPWVILFWYTYIFVTTFGLVHVMIGLYCESVLKASELTAKEIESAKEERRKNTIAQLEHMFHTMDQDASESISRDEFKEALAQDEVLSCIENLGLADEGDLFDTLDVDHEGELSFTRFFEGMMMLARGGEKAKAKDIAATFLTCQAIKNTLVEKDVKTTSGPFKVFETRISKLAEDIEALPCKNLQLRSNDEPEQVRTSSDLQNHMRPSETEVAYKQVPLPTAAEKQGISSLQPLGTKMEARMDSLTNSVHNKVDEVQTDLHSLDDKLDQLVSMVCYKSHTKAATATVNK